MIKQVLITGVAAAGLLLSAQASAHKSGGSVIVWNNSSNSSAHGHSHKHRMKKVRRAPPKYNVDREQQQQATMIAQGIKTCQITPKEAKKLNKQQAKIRKAERRMRKNGLSYSESMDLKTRLHTARVQINKLTKNSKQCGRSKKRRHSHSKSYGHSHGGSYHKHTRGNKYHGHKSRSNQGTFSISFGH